MAGMTKRKAKKRRKEEPTRQQYQEYLKTEKRKGRASFKKAKTYYEWKKMTPRTRGVHYAMSRS